MDERLSNEWQLPPWTEDALDPLWPADSDALNALDALDPSLGASNVFIPHSRPTPSPGCTLDLTSFQAMAQRQHSLPRRRSKYLLRRPGSASISSPIAIPGTDPTPISSPHSERGHSLTMQRWQDSPPEEEAASLSAISRALESGPLCRDAYYSHRGHSSTTSIDSGVSESSLRSCNSSRSATSHAKRRSQTPRTRAKAIGKGKSLHSADRIFKCTFCCDTFKHKYDWTRHEKSLHLNLEEWTCAPNGPSVVLPLTGRVHCAYCSALDPTPEHLQNHNHLACTDGRAVPRCFRRKDHLVQHLRLVHGLNTLPLIQDWKLEAIPVVSRCGFCSAKLNSWDERADHLTAHFREGKTMADWRGDHGFDPTITARLTHAFPPYLIAAQSNTLVPFSATDPASIDHTKQLLSQIDLSTSAPPEVPDPKVHQQLFDAHSLPTQQDLDTRVIVDILSHHLSSYARQQMLAGIIPTDEMLQRESRRVLYLDGDDDWNQTVADDPEWIHDFRQRFGFGGNPSV